MASSMGRMLLVTVALGAACGLCGGWLVLGDALLVDLRPVEFRRHHYLENGGGPALTRATQVHGGTEWKRMRNKRIPFELTVQAHPVRPFLPIRGPVAMEMVVEGDQVIFTFEGVSGETMTLGRGDGGVFLRQGDAAVDTPMGADWTYRILRRLLETPFVLDEFVVRERMGPVTIDDANYERVFASAGPLTDVSVEQSAIVFDPRTGRLAWMEITDRGLGKAMHYRADYTYSPVTESIQTPEDIVLHELTLTGNPLLRLHVGSVRP